MEQPPDIVTLIGRSSAWGLRVAAPLAHQPGSRQATRPAHSRVVVAWLHHRSYGTLGVYLAQPPDERSILPPARQWLQVRGRFQPWRVHAQPDNPCCASAPAFAPRALLLSEITTITITRSTSWDTAVLQQLQHIRVLPGRRCGRSSIAPVAQQPDCSYWQPAGTIPAIASWNRIVGVVSTLGATRSLRYVLSATAPYQERA